jgi:glycosyltransferase involved in cell wall biosynthesis
MMEPNVESISAALLRMISMSDTVREVMGMNGCRLVKQRFQWLRIGQQMSDVYDWMLSGSRPGTVKIFG